MRRPQRLEAKSKLEMLYRLAITQIWKKLTASLSSDNVCPNPSKIWFDFTMTAGCWSEADVCRLLRLDFFMNQRYRVIFQCVPPSCITAKHLLFETQMSGASIASQTQSARKIALSNHAARLCGAADQCSPLSNPYFIWALKLIS